MLAGHQQAIAGQTTCPFDLNAWRILHPPKLSVYDLNLLSIFLRVSKKLRCQTTVEGVKVLGFQAPHNRYRQLSVSAGKVGIA